MTNLTQRTKNLYEKYKPFLAGALLPYAAPTSIRLIDQYNEESKKLYKSGRTYARASDMLHLYGVFSGVLMGEGMFRLFYQHPLIPSNILEIKDLFSALGILYITNVASSIHERRRKDKLEFDEFKKKIEEILKNQNS